MTKISIELEVNEQELMSAVFDNLSEPWWLSYDWSWKANEVEVTKVVNIRYDDEETEGGASATVTLEDILAAYAKVAAGKYYHCGYEVTADYEDWDSCCSDIILQVAIFGKVIFG